MGGGGGAVRGSTKEHNTESTYNPSRAESGVLVAVEQAQEAGHVGGAEHAFPNVEAVVPWALAQHNVVDLPLAKRVRQDKEKRIQWDGREGQWIRS
jgi:hypothetical protein